MMIRLTLSLLMFGGTVANAVDVPTIKNAAAAQSTAEPILYKVGAGGITFMTPKADAELVLGSPVGDTGKVVSYYKNGMWVVWNDEDPNVAYSMGIESGYGGELALPAPYNAVRIGGLLKAAFTEMDPLALTFLREIYRFYEGGAPDYDCVGENTCMARRTPDGYNVLATPKMNLIIKDGVLFRIVLKS